MKKKKRRRGGHIRLGPLKKTGAITAEENKRSVLGIHKLDHTKDFSIFHFFCFP
jgi:hypothetical protein